MIKVIDPARIDSNEGLTTITFNRIFQQSPEMIWKYLVETHELSRWFPADLRGDKKVGAAIQIVSFTDRFPPANGIIICFQPYHLFEYSWEDETLRWEINESASGTDLTFLNKMTDAKAKSVGTADIATAWHSCLDVLEYVVKEQTPPFSTEERFVQINSTYHK